MTTESKKFNTLPISTQTVMAYANCTFNIENIFNNLPVDETGETNIKKIAGKHGTIYQLKCAGRTRGIQSKKGVFRNQITACIFIIDKMITMKIFPTGKFHLTGCKNSEHQQQAVAELLHHIRRVHTDEHPTFFMDDQEPLNVILEVVMVNVDFHLGFDVDQQKLDSVLQQEANDFYTIYETPVNTSVNIKLDYTDPQEKTFNKVVITGPPEAPVTTVTTTNTCPKAKPNNTRTHTFLVFSSSKVIQSGRYYDSEMEPAYKKFNELIQKHKKSIELKLMENKFDMSSLIGMREKTPMKLKPLVNPKIHLK
jgi:TATA-box binding protein (TBP) (component of TFIID and TFIIIB)